eukprot:766570-Hanusia_phi.AAC.3
MPHEELNVRIGAENTLKISSFTERWPSLSASTCEQFDAPPRRIYSDCAKKLSLKDGDKSVVIKCSNGVRKLPLCSTPFPALPLPCPVPCAAVAAFSDASTAVEGHRYLESLRRGEDGVRRRAAAPLCLTGP